MDVTLRLQPALAGWSERTCALVAVRMSFKHAHSARMNASGTNVYNFFGCSTTHLQSTPSSDIVPMLWDQGLSKEVGQKERSHTFLCMTDVVLEANLWDVKFFDVLHYQLSNSPFSIAAVHLSLFLSNML